MYFLIAFQPTSERAVYQTDELVEKFTVKDLLDWICKRFHFESSSGETGNRRLALFYEHTELQNDWFLQDINIQFGATIKCSVKEGMSSREELVVRQRNGNIHMHERFLSRARDLKK